MAPTFLELFQLWCLREIPHFRAAPGCYLGGVNVDEVVLAVLFVCWTCVPPVVELLVFLNQVIMMFTFVLFPFCVRLQLVLVQFTTRFDVVALRQ